MMTTKQRAEVWRKEALNKLCHQLGGCVDSGKRITRTLDGERVVMTPCDRCGIPFEVKP